MHNKFKTHCPKGHEYTLENTYNRVSGKYVMRRCKQCHSDREVARYHKNPQTKLKTIARVTKRQKDPIYNLWRGVQQRLRRYNLTLEQYNSMLASQDFHCLFCDEKECLAVDHDHKTGKVRGLLCRQHNSALGLFKEDPIALRKAADYLESHR